MGFTSVRHARIKTLQPGAVVQLRFGKTSTARKDDQIKVAKFVSFTKGDERSLAEFEETDDSGAVTVTTLTKFPNGPWLSGAKIVSLVGIDEATYDLDTTKRTGPVVDHIADAIVAITKNAQDVFAAEQLVELLTEINSGVRINRKVKSLANKFSAGVISELAPEEEEEAAPAAEATAPAAEFVAPEPEPAYAGAHREGDGYTSTDSEGYAV